MIPILFESTETSFATNGIGRLIDCKSCTVTEERNGIYECKFEYPVTGQHYDDITEGRIIYCLHDESGIPQPFDIYSHTAPSSGIVTFYARHISYRLANVMLSPFTATSVASTFVAISANSINTNPFTFWTDKTTSGTFKVTAPISVKEFLGGSDGSVLDVCGDGEYEWDKLTVRFYASRGQDNGVKIRYGYNLSSATQEYDISDTYNAVAPYWVDPTTGEIVTVAGYIVTVDSLDQPLKPVPLDLSTDFDEQPTESQLRAKALSFLLNNEPWVPDENITVDFVPLWQTEEYANVAALQRLRLCDTAHIYYPELNINTSKKVIKTVYNALLERYDSMELGKPQSSFSQVVRGSVDEDLAKINATLAAIEGSTVTQSMLDEAIENATKAITGADGGYILDVYNAAGERVEMLIMDTKNINTAQKVWRWNSGGFGYSSTGYNGPYTTAITQNGEIVANFITTGTMSANIIKGGTLKLGGSSNGNGVLAVYDASNNLVGQWNNNGVVINKGSLNINNGAFQVTSSGAVTAESLTANDYIYLDGNINSYLKIPFSLGANNQYMELSSSGFKLNAYGQSEGINWTGGPETQTVQFGTPRGEWYDEYAAIKISGPRFNNYSNLSAAYIYMYSPSYDGSYTAYTSMLPGMVHLNEHGYEAYYYAAWCQTDTVRADSHIISSGDLIVYGTKSRHVTTDQYSNRLLYCYETPSPMFGDIGEGEIADDGKCYVWLDPIFAQTIADTRYQVFLQCYGDGNCYVSERKHDYFVVQGTVGLAFGWEIKAKQRDHDQKRLETPEYRDVDFSHGIQYGELATNHIEEIKKERENV